MKILAKVLFTLAAFITFFIYFNQEGDFNANDFYGDDTFCKVWPNNNTDYYVLQKCK